MTPGEPPHADAPENHWSRWTGPEDPNYTPPPPMCLPFIEVSPDPPEPGQASLAAGKRHEVALDDLGSYEVETLNEAA